MLFVKKRGAISSRPPAQHVPPVFHFDWTCLLVWLVQLSLLLNAPQTVGVTHWKLIDNEIIPEPAASSMEPQRRAQQTEETHKHDSLYAVSKFSSSDPEFAMLVRYSARGSLGGNGGSLNRGGGGFGTFRRQGGSLGSCYYGEEEWEGGSRCAGGVAGEGGEMKKMESSVAMKQPRKSDGSLM